MKTPFGVVDGDGHILEPERRLREYIQGPYGEMKQIHCYFPNKDGIVGTSASVLATKS